MVSGRLPPRKIAPPRSGFGLGLVLELGLGGAIFLGGNCPRTRMNILRSIK